MLTTPENLFGREACHPGRAPEESYRRLADHFHKMLPSLSDAEIERLVKK